jgi:hypothetical protein
MYLSGNTLTLANGTIIVSTDKNPERSDIRHFAKMGANSSNRYVMGADF